MADSRDLLEPEKLYSRADILAQSCPVPRLSGVYAWWFRTALLPGVPLDDCREWQGRHLLYIGIAPRKPSAAGRSSTSTLRDRLRYHYAGNAEGSTLRRTLGCLLGLELRRVGSGKTMTFSEQEAELNDWMQENAFVCWLTEETPWQVETDLIERLSLPLNLDQNRQHTFHGHLSRMRRQAIHRAKQLPILPRLHARGDAGQADRLL
jgi:hypothetical protein